MDLMGQTVQHTTFGTGRVVLIDNGHMVIQFAENIGEKNFLYPEAFQHFMKMSASAAQDIVAKDLSALASKCAEEKTEREQRCRETLEQHYAARLAERKTTRKPAVRKTAAKPRKKTKEETAENPA